MKQLPQELANSQMEIKMSKRLEILKASLIKKQAEFDRKLQDHFETVKQANGQPLNDKRNGRSALDKWERQNDGLRTLQEGINKTKEAIEREESLIANAGSFEIPECLRGLVESGRITQWRKHPRFFFVVGVEKARIVVTEDGKLAHRYAKDIPTKEQHAIFRDAYNEAVDIENLRIWEKVKG